jgi:hemolysin D
MSNDSCQGLPQPQIRGGPTHEDNMVETSLRRAHIRLTAALWGFLIIIIAVSVIGEVDVTATGFGRIIPDGKVKVIQSFETGLVEQIAVDDGSRVTSGDLLIQLETKDARADERRVGTELAIMRVEFARLQATIDYEKEIPFVPPEGSPQYAVLLSEALMRNQISELTALIAQIDSDIREKEALVASTLIAIKKNTELLPIQQEREEMRGRLVAKNVTPRLVYLDDKEKLTTLEMDLAAQQSRLNEVQAALSSLREKRKNTILGFKSARLTEFVETQRRMLTLSEDYAKAAERLRRHTIVAPISGTVQDSSIHTIGGVVTPSESLMTIVPLESKLIVEVLIPNKDIGFVQVGQSAELAVTTFDYRYYGTITGRVRSISKDAVKNDTNSTRNQIRPTKTQIDTSDKMAELKKLMPALDEGPIFRGEITLDETAISINGNDIDLTPGMTVDVNILITRRRIIDFFLAPFRTYQSTAFRQRTR